MFFQILPQWGRWDLLKRHAMVIPRPTVSTHSRTPRVSLGPISLFRPSGPVTSSSPIHSRCLTPKGFLLRAFLGSLPFLIGCQFSLGIPKWLASSPPKGHYLVIEGTHVFIMVPLLVAESGIDFSCPA